MDIRNLFVGLVAALFSTSAAQAEPSIFSETKPIEYTRVCDAYGAGYFYIPGTETCMRLSGFVRSEIKGGRNVYARRYKDERPRDTYVWLSRATLRSHTISETELGALRTFIELRSDWIGGAERGNARDGVSGQLRYAYIELGGLHFGLDESIFHYWTGGFGNVIHDDILNPLSSSRTNAIGYVFDGSNGYSAILGLEQGKNDSDFAKDGFRFNNQNELITRKLRQQIEGYMPNVIAGVKYSQGWGGISSVVAYDAYYSEVAGKLRIDIDMNNQISLWAMGGYKTMEDYYDLICRESFSTYRLANSIYGDWGGHWAFWGGGTYKLSEQVNLNLQLAYEEARTLASSINLSYELVPGLNITPELAYISWNDKYSSSTSPQGKDAFQGVIRLQRSF